MKKQFLTGIFAASALAIGCVGQTSSVEAFTVTRVCASGYANNVDPTGAPFNRACELGTQNIDAVPGGISTTPNPNHRVNLDSMFGYKDWIFRGRDGVDSTTNPNFLNFASIFAGGDNPNRRQGTYNLTGIAQSSWSDVMLVFRGGDGANIVPQNYVGYLLAKDSHGGWTGTWTTPFDNTNNSGSQFDANVFHISLYYREATPVPAPALIPSLIGVGVAALRKKKREEKVAQEA